MQRGDVVICEAPSFIGSLNSFRSYGVRLRGVPMDDDGMNLEALETALREELTPSYLYHSQLSKSLRYHHEPGKTEKGV